MVRFDRKEKSKARELEEKMGMIPKTGVSVEMLEDLGKLHDNL